MLGKQLGDASAKVTRFSWAVRPKSKIPLVSTSGAAASETVLLVPKARLIECEVSHGSREWGCTVL